MEAERVAMTQEEEETLVELANRIGEPATAVWVATILLERAMENSWDDIGQLEATGRIATAFGAAVLAKAAIDRIPPREGKPQ